MKSDGLAVIAVDDDEGLLSFLGTAFKAAKSFSAFPAAADFLARAELEHCDIVFVDINMPGGQNGIELTRHIKRVAPQCDVVVMTGEATLDNAMAAIRAGAYDFLTKPFTFDHLESTVDRCAEKRAISLELKLMKAAQEELSAAYSQLKSSERMKEAFLSVIGHELRTPLAKIMGGLELLGEAGEAERSVLLDAAMGGARELHEVIESLILYAVSQKEPAPLNCAAVDINQLVRAVAGGLAGKAAAEGVTFSVNCAPGKAEVQGEPEWIASALKRLAQNAIMYNNRGGRAEISVKDEASLVSVTVEDSGIGIPEELLSGVGSPFYQVADYLTRKTGGLGLGLAIVKRVAEAHKGGVSVRSEPGKGTAFTVTFGKGGSCAG